MSCDQSSLLNAKLDVNQKTIPSSVCRNCRVFIDLTISKSSNSRDVICHACAALTASNERNASSKLAAKHEFQNLNSTQISPLVKEKEVTIRNKDEHHINVVTVDAIDEKYPIGSKRNVSLLLHNEEEEEEEKENKDNHHLDINLHCLHEPLRSDEALDVDKSDTQTNSPIVWESNAGNCQTHHLWDNANEIHRLIEVSFSSSILYVSLFFIFFLNKISVLCLLFLYSFTLHFQYQIFFLNYFFLFTAFCSKNTLLFPCDVLFLLSTVHTVLFINIILIYMIIISIMMHYHPLYLRRHLIHLFPFILI